MAPPVRAPQWVCVILKDHDSQSPFQRIRNSHFPKVKPAPTLATVPTEVLEKIFHAAIPEPYRVSTGEVNADDMTFPDRPDKQPIELFWEPAWAKGMRLISKHFKEVADPILYQYQELDAFKLYGMPDEFHPWGRVFLHMRRCLISRKESA